MARAARPALLLLAVVVALSICGCGGGDEKAPAEAAESADAGTPDEAALPEDEAEAEPSVDPLPRRSVDIYFPSTVADGLIAESREIFDTATPGDQVKQIVNDLMSEPTREKAGRAVPAGTRLRQVYVLDDGVAWLDFTSELSDGLGGGSLSELLAVYAIVDSVVANVPQVRRVGILIEGHQVETLNGHLHLLKPLRPNYSLVLESQKAEGPEPGTAEDAALAEIPAD